MVDSSFLHRLRCPKFISSYQQTYFTRKFCKINCLFQCSISSTNHNQMLITENRQSSITNCTSRNSSLPKLFFTRKSQTYRSSSCRNNQRLSFIDLRSYKNFKRLLTQINFIYRFSFYLYSKIN